MYSKKKAHPSFDFDSLPGSIATLWRCNLASDFSPEIKNTERLNLEDQFSNEKHRNSIQKLNSD